MRPYRFKMRLSSKRLNVTRLGKALAAALRAAARFSLGSASSDIELMAHLLVITGVILFRKPVSTFRDHCRELHDRADRRPLQEPAWQPQRDSCGGLSWSRSTRKKAVTGSLAKIIIPPNFRPATAQLDCDKRILRWPGPFGSGFLSPQPPGAVRIGPVRRNYPHTG